MRELGFVVIRNRIICIFVQPWNIIILIWGNIEDIPLVTVNEAAPFGTLAPSLSLSLFVSCCPSVVLHEKCVYEGSAVNHRAGIKTVPPRGTKDCHHSTWNNDGGGGDDMHIRNS